MAIIQRTSEDISKNTGRSNKTLMSSFSEAEIEAFMREDGEDNSKNSIISHAILTSQKSKVKLHSPSLK